jgi:sulfoquinovosyltransferase
MAIGGSEIKDDLEGETVVLDGEAAGRPRRVALFVEPSPFA